MKALPFQKHSAQRLARLSGEPSEYRSASHYTPLVPCSLLLAICCSSAADDTQQKRDSYELYPRRDARCTVENAPNDDMICRRDGVTSDESAVCVSQWCRSQERV